ncbi:MAG: polysaccharide deacetylase family protein, partial [Syntrophomonas sp.]|nr:polysaccharide deacetylase family protein [Syntrophomonas sp.]
MMKHKCLFYTMVMIFIFGLGMTGCQSGIKPVSSDLPQVINLEGSKVQHVQPNLTQQVLVKYANAQPQQWGEKVSGVAHSLDTKQKVLALTFDACGGSTRSNGYDASLIDYLEKMQIPATLFISGKWIDANPKIFLNLAHNELFEIGNHGLNHLPCSVTGKSAYSIKGTGSVAEVTQEIESNGIKIKSLTGREPHFYRSGTNYYDEVAVALARDLGYTTVGYSVLGDAGATYSR